MKYASQTVKPVRQIDRSNLIRFIGQRDIQPTTIKTRKKRRSNTPIHIVIRFTDNGSDRMQYDPNVDGSWQEFGQLLRSEYPNNPIIAYQNISGSRVYVKGYTPIDAKRQSTTNR